ncbi:MAG: hypothetical protein RB191_11335, partial [Terriglobia bacterium]|nr:hypothetical protein [Terriglobia bacterium]
SLLTAENNRRAMQLEVDKQELQLRMRKQELEFEHLDAMAEQRRKDREDNAKLREQRKQWAADAREKKRQKEQALVGSQSYSGGASPGCRVCADGGNPHLGADEILWHHNGHRAVS